ncbi:AI-2E family transporter [Aquabacterium sp.]|uniref:AI-2E family transporter n=1 Tax=Aquabacterium sp. TaxID=1872578 RepID=UPI002487229A|nr:AI-2E family transporter [Aquabacterium sp.]MDI1258874.1 AI-2E family transporter [Aquabacterium sp.]
MTSLNDSYKPKLAWGLLIAVLVLFVWKFAAALAPFMLSLVLAYGLKPAVDSLVKRGVPRAVSVALCVLLALLMVLTLLVLLVPIVSQVVPMLKAQVPDLFSNVWISVQPWLSQLGVELPSLEEGKAMLVEWINSHASQWAGAIVSSVLIGGGGLMTLLGFLLMVPMLAFYWLMDWDDIIDRGWRLLPPRWRPAVKEVLTDCDEVLGQFLRGQVLVMLIMAVFYSVALALAGFKLALPIGVFTGLAMCIPYLGFGVGLVLALLSGVLQFSPTTSGMAYPLIAVAVVYGGGQVLESFFLTPRLVGGRIGLHPLAVIFALLLFGQALGFVGVLIALPVSALLLVLARRALTSYRRSRAFLGTPDPEQG